MLDAHMQRFTFSPLGALRWKRDLADYAALVGRLRSAPSAAHLDDMQARVRWRGWVGGGGGGTGGRAVECQRLLACPSTLARS